MKNIFVLIMLILINSVSYASVPLTFYSSARPMGMGGAFTAVADDVNAIFYNPAGVVFNDKEKMSISCTSLGGDQSPVYFAADYNIKDSLIPRFIFGLMDLQYLGSDGKQLRNSMYHFAFPIRIRDELSISLGYKRESSDISSRRYVNNDTGTVGVSYYISKSLRLGLFIDGIFIHRQYEYSSLVGTTPVATTEEGPTSSTIGIVYYFTDNKSSLSCDLSYLDTARGASQNIRHHIGMEHKLSEIIDVRCGYATSNIDDELGYPTIGFGFRLPYNLQLQIAGAFENQRNSFSVSISYVGNHL